MIIDIHGDDYGYSLNTSKEILDCMKQGCLDSISIICNTNGFEESIKLLYDAIPSLPFLPLISVHINLPEGKGNILPLSWSKLFLSNSNIKEDLKKEIKIQIDLVEEVIEHCIDIADKNNIKHTQKGLRIDSHIHTHPIPIVWKSLIEVLQEGKYNIEYIRNPKEPIIPFLKHFKLIPSYGLMNIVKNRILMFYSRKIDKYCTNNKLDKMYMWGLTMSGHMDFDRIKVLYQDMYDYALKHNRNLELLFHPGIGLKEEYSDEMNKEYFKNANLSNNRNIEKEAVLRIKEIVRQLSDKEQ